VSTDREPKDEVAPLDVEQLPELEELTEVDVEWVELEELHVLAFTICVDMVGTRRIVARAIKVPVMNTNFCIFQGT
jgi:hypothetical protein